MWNDKNRHLIITLFQVDLPFKRLHCRVFPLRGCVTAKNIDSSVSNEVTGKNFSSPPANPVNRDMVSAQTKMIRKKKHFGNVVLLFCTTAAKIVSSVCAGSLLVFVS